MLGALPVLEMYPLKQLALRVCGLVGEGAGCCTCFREVSPEAVDTQGICMWVRVLGALPVLEKYPLS